MPAPAHSARIATARPRHGSGCERQLRAPRVALIQAIVAAKRREHPALAATRVSLAALRAAVAREGVVYMERPAPSYGWCVPGVLAHGFPHAVMISSNLTSRAKRLVLAHECGHLWLHADDPITAAWRREEMAEARASGRCEADWPFRLKPGETFGPIFERFEEEADLFGSSLLGMPAVAFIAAHETLMGRPRIWRAARGAA